MTACQTDGLASRMMNDGTRPPDIPRPSRTHKRLLALPYFSPSRRNKPLVSWPRRPFPVFEVPWPPSWEFMPGRRLRSLNAKVPNLILLDGPVVRERGDRRRWVTLAVSGRYLCINQATICAASRNWTVGIASLQVTALHSMKETIPMQPPVSCSWISIRADE